MPNENIKRSIAKAAGELGNVNYEEIQYEGYAAGWRRRYRFDRYGQS